MENQLANARTHIYGKYHARVCMYNCALKTFYYLFIINVSVFFSNHWHYIIYTARRDFDILSAVTGGLCAQKIPRATRIILNANVYYNNMLLLLSSLSCTQPKTAAWR